MEAVHDVVIVGAGLTGLATSLGLHRKGVRSLVLESSDTLRASGYVLMTWTNAWRALEALGVADSLRRRHPRLDRVLISSASSGALISEISLRTHGNCGEHEGRVVRRNTLLKVLARDLPEGTIRFSSKVVSIDEDEGHLKLLHIADGSVLRAKVIIGCDGVNSAVAKWMELSKPSLSGRWAARGFTTVLYGHGFKSEFLLYCGKGFRCGVLPCDKKSVYWFFSWTPISKDKEMEGDTTMLTKFILERFKMSKVPEKVAQVVEMSDMGSVHFSPLGSKSPFDLIRENISKGNVCVAGDALHAMNPDLGQGGCAALEDGIVLARCLGDALISRGSKGNYEGIRDALKKYAAERRWRSFKLITLSYIVGRIQDSNGVIMDFLRDKALAGTVANIYLHVSDFDCGKL